MTSEKTDAIVIRQVDFSETSRVLTLFTEGFGKISVLAKGVRRLKGPFQSGLDLLSVCGVVFLRKSSSHLHILTEAQLIKRFQPGGKDLRALYGGYYVAELLQELTLDEDPHPQLYRESVETLGWLSGGGDPLVGITQFELKLLQEIGQLPAMDVCVKCGEESQPGKGPYGYFQSQGGLICRGCQNEGSAGATVSGGAIAVWKHLVNQRDASRISVSSGQIRELRGLLNRVMTHLLERRPKLARYLSYFE